MLRSGGLNTSITELLHLLEAMQYGIAKFSVENFYYLSRSILVKDESLFDRFDQIFTAHFSGIEKIINELFKDVPEEWLRKQAQLMLTEEERAQIESMGGFEKLIETLKKRFEEQKDRHREEASGSEQQEHHHTEHMDTTLKALESVSRDQCTDVQ